MGIYFLLKVSLQRVQFEAPILNTYWTPPPPRHNNDSVTLPRTSDLGLYVRMPKTDTEKGSAVKRTQKTY